jgi:hypothetical protein
MKKEDHAIQAEHHVAMCKMHNALHKTLEDGDLKTFHKAAADEHLRMADHHAECCKALVADSPSKILSTRERFGKATEDEISGIAPPNPNLRLIARDGSPTPQEIDESEQIPERHAHIFKRGAAPAQ